MSTDSSTSDEDAARRRTCPLQALVFALPITIAGILLKIFEYQSERSKVLVLRAMGRSSLDLWTGVHLFAMDVVLGLFTAVVFLAVTWRMPARWTRIVGGSVAVGLGTIASISWLSETATGRLPTASLVRDFVISYRSNPETMAPAGFISGGNLVRAAVVLMMTLVPWLALAPTLLRQLERRALRQAVLSGATMLSAGCLLLVAWGGTPTWLHRPFYGRVFGALMPTRAGWPEVTMTIAGIQDEYRRIAYSRPGDSLDPAAAAVSRLAGAARGYNLIVVVEETLAYRDYAFTDSTLPWHTVRRLLPHSIVGLRHHSPHPNSGRADFSLLTGLYDLPGDYSFERSLSSTGVEQLPAALPWILRRQGYFTGYYIAGAFTLPEDAWVARSAGFQRVWHGEGELTSPGTAARRRLNEEQRLFDQVAQDLERQPRQPFFLMVRSMIGHDPVLEPNALESPKRYSTGPSAAGRRFVAGIEDSLLGRLVRGLERRGELDRTIIVVVGDHGARLHTDPDIRVGVLNEVTYHVPLLIYGGAAIPQTIETGAVTSHVDLLPTLLELLGVPRPNWVYQGLSFSDQRLTHRPTFFLGEQYEGANGVREDSWYLAHNTVTGLTFVNDRFEFDEGNLVPNGNASRLADQLHTTLHDFLNLQRAIWPLLQRTSPALAGGDPTLSTAVRPGLPPS